MPIDLPRPERIPPKYVPISARSAWVARSQTFPAMTPRRAGSRPFALGGLRGVVEIYPSGRPGARDGATRPADFFPLFATYGGMGSPEMNFQALTAAQVSLPTDTTSDAGLQVTTPPLESVSDHQTAPGKDVYQHTHPSGFPRFRPNGCRGNPGASGTPRRANPPLSLRWAQPVPKYGFRLKSRISTNSRRYRSRCAGRRPEDQCYPS